MKQKIESHPYIVSVLLVVVALLGHFAGPSAKNPLTPHMLFMTAIVLSTWIGGLKPGLGSLALSLLTINFALTPPIGSFAIARSIDTVPLAVFSLESMFAIGIVHMLRERQRHLEKSLEESEAALGRAEEANQLKRNFIANMSHEIRAPLSAVLGFSDLLTSDKVSRSEKATYVERLKVNASSLTQLVTDLLDVTEIDPGYFVANRRKMSVPALVQKSYEIFAPLAQEKGLRFQVHLRGSVPTVVESDQEQLLQILRHVVGNAVKYSESGTIHLTVSSSKTENGRRELALIVSDQGSGISPEVKKKLFKPFSNDSQIGEGSSKTHGGTGLGLTIARRLARGLGGDVKLAKSDRKGSTFLITFDGGPANLANEFFDALAEATRTPLVSPDDPRALDGVKVLVVDDSPDSAILVSRMLKLVGADVDTAYNAIDGVDKAMDEHPDIVLMDIQMPEVDGNEAIRRLRKNGFTNPIFALSAHVMKEDREEANRSGATDYVMKPVSRRALLQRIARYVKGTPGSGVAPLEPFQTALSAIQTRPPTPNPNTLH